jgi:hypothetical protein
MVAARVSELPYQDALAVLPRDEGVEPGERRSVEGQDQDVGRGRSPVQCPAGSLTRWSRSAGVLGLAPLSQS